MAKYKMRITRTETKEAFIDVDAVSPEHAEAVAEIQSGNIDFSDKSVCNEPSYDMEVAEVLDTRPTRAVLWTVDPKTCVRNSSGTWDFSGLKRVNDKTFTVDDKTDFIRLLCEQIPDPTAADYIRDTMEVRYLDGSVSIVDTTDGCKPYFLFDLKAPEAKTWKEWWRHITCFACDQCESMPGDEQRWHSQTFEFIRTLNGKDDPEELHDHAIYRCPECKGYVIDELVEETMDESGIVEDSEDD